LRADLIILFINLHIKNLFMFNYIFNVFAMKKIRTVG